MTQARRLAAAAWLALAALLWTAAATPALGQGIGLPRQEGEQPIEIYADEGIEWRQDARTYVARGNARAVQGEVAVHADTLTAHYRDSEAGKTEIFRIDADGNVRITSPRQTAYGEKAVYDVANGVLVLTGAPRLVTETERITATKSLEFWEKRSMAVARGDAVAIREDQRLRADILTAHFKEDDTGKAAISRVEAFDDVLISTPDEIVRGQKGVYNVETGMAVLTGSVKITRGEDQLNGAAAEVNMNTGVSRLLSGPDAPVRGSIRSRAVRPNDDGDRRAR